MADENPDVIDFDKLLAPYAKKGNEKGYRPIDLSPTKLIKEAWSSGHEGVVAGGAGATVAGYKMVTGYGDAVKQAQKDLISRFKQEQELAGKVTNSRIAIGNTQPTAPNLTSEGRVVRKGLAKELAKERLLSKFGVGDDARIIQLTTPQVRTTTTPDLRSPNLSMHTPEGVAYDAKKLAELGKSGKLAAGTDVGILNERLRQIEGLPKVPASFLERVSSSAPVRMLSSPWVTRPIRVIDALSNTADVINRHSYNSDRESMGQITAGEKWTSTGEGVARGVGDFYSLGVNTALGNGYQIEEDRANTRATQEYMALNKKDPVKYPLVPFKRPYSDGKIEMITPNSPEFNAMWYNHLTQEGVPNYFASPRYYYGPEYDYKVVDGKIVHHYKPEITAALDAQSEREMIAASRHRPVFNTDPAFGAIGWQDHRPTAFNFGDYLEYQRQ